MPNYGDAKYWDKRYKEQESTFDWLEDWAALRPIIDNLIPKDAKILMLGCGNSEMSEKMYDDGYKNITNIDISSVVVDQMNSRSAGNRPEMKYEVMDVRELTYPAEHFDMAIDKSTMDALLCGDNSFINVAMMTKEVQRVLKKSGYYFAISYGLPENRVLHFKKEHLSMDLNIIKIEPKTAKVGSEHFCYIGKKRDDADEVCMRNWEKVEKELLEEEEKERERMESNNSRSRHTPSHVESEDIEESEEISEIRQSPIPPEGAHRTAAEEKAQKNYAEDT